MYRNVIWIICGLFALSASQRYRTDYEYNRKSNAFYKFHPELLYWSRAREVCLMEGAQLMVPERTEDVVQAHLMFKRYPDLDYAWVGDDGKEHDSADEFPIIDLTPEINEYRETSRSRSKCNVVSHSGEVQSNMCFILLPFICKVEANDAYIDPQCKVYGKNYTFVSNTSSCYKIPRIACTWNEAYNECKAEEAHLVVINSEAESQALRNIFLSNPAVVDSKAPWFFFAGFRARRTDNGTSRVFRTIFNQTLEEAGFSQWCANEPNNVKDAEYCGSIFQTNGKFNDLNCMDRHGFVCEKEIVPNSL